MKWTIVLPYLTKSDNAFKNKKGTSVYWKYKKYKEHLEQDIWFEVLRQDIPKALGKRKVTITRYSPYAIDYGNFVGGCKPILDGLVMSGALKDDSMEWCKEEYEFIKVSKRVDMRTEITIEEM